MQKSKKKFKSNKLRILLIIVLISILIVIPNLLISIQRDSEIPIEEKNLNEIINTRPPQESSVYYEDTTGRALSVYVSGDYAYVADEGSGLAVIDISDPTNPGTPVYENTTGYAYGVYVSGDYAYVADYTSGLAVIQVRKRVDNEAPIISNAPSDFNVEAGYTGQSISWTATDANPDTYTIELLGTGIVAGPTVWTSGVAITYNIPDGFSPGVYTYNITFTDESGNSISNTVTVTIKSIPGGALPFELIIIASVIGGGAVIGVAVVILLRRKRKE